MPVARKPSDRGPTPRTRRQVKASDKSVVMRRVVKSENTASMGESIVAVTRLRLAVEGAVRKNIAEGLQAISALPI